MSTRPLEPSSAKPIDTATNALWNPTLRAVLDAVRLGPATTRRDVAAFTGLTTSVVARAVNDLVKLGILQYHGEVANKPRAPRTFGLAGRSRWVLAIDIKAIRLDVAAVDLTGRTLLRIATSLERDHAPEDVLSLVDLAHRQFSQQLSSADSDVVAVSASLPGWVDVERGFDIVLSSLPRWIGFPLHQRLRDRFSVPVSVEHDVKAIATAELRAGALRGTTCGLVVKLDTGVGASITVGDNVFRGTQGWAGNLGHICVDTGTTIQCTCGNSGCLESFVGVDGLIGAAVKLALQHQDGPLHERWQANDSLSVEDIVECAGRGDPQALHLLQKASRLTGHVLSIAVNILNPDVVILEGSPVASTEIFLSGVRAEIYKRSHPFITKRLSVWRSSFGEDEGVLGCAWLALDKFFSKLPSTQNAQVFRLGAY